MKKKVKLIILIAVGVVLLAAVIVAALRPLAVETVAVAPETAVLTFTEQGSYVYGTSYTVYPIVSGELLEVRVEKGDIVKKGDVLAVVSASDYESQIEQLTASITGYEAQISNLWLSEQQQRDSLAATLAGLKGQLATLESEQTMNQRNTESIENQIAVQESIVSSNASYASHTRQELQDARDSDDEAWIAQARQADNVARNTLAQSRVLLEQLRAGDVPDDLYEGQKNAIQAQIDAIGAQIGKYYSGGMQGYYNAQIEASQLAIAQMEEKAGKAEVTAPMDGVVSELPAGEKNLISQAEPVAMLGASPRLEVYVPVRELDGIAVGDEVALILDKRLGEESLSGKVTEIGAEAEVRLSALGVEERKVRVLIEPEPGLSIGYEVDARFTVYTQENAIVIPKTALFSADGSDWIWVIEESKLARRAVVRGIETREGYIIDEGLSAGEQVVKDADNAALSEGKAVA